ncbi:unnamed protein product [marine sediment metagenome]|uniref:Uncharacterized protein n=1 Tax=marine sediment metagenome TaxID=412755 RepID=X1E7F4_9ZZZZ
MLSEKMDTERKDDYEVVKVQQKNREDLESYKELLKKELDSIRSLVGEQILLEVVLPIVESYSTLQE